MKNSENEGLGMLMQTREEYYELWLRRTETIADMKPNVAKQLELTKWEKNLIASYPIEIVGVPYHTDIDAVKQQNEKIMRYLPLPTEVFPPEQYALSGTVYSGTSDAINWIEMVQETCDPQEYAYFKERVDEVHEIVDPPKFEEEVRKKLQKLDNKLLLSLFDKIREKLLLAYHSDDDLEYLTLDMRNLLEKVVGEVWIKVPHQKKGVNPIPS